MIRLVSTTALVLALSAAPASADHLRELSFTATVNIGSIQGVLVDGSVIYDTTASPIVTGAGFARYPLVDAQVRLDGVGLAYDPTGSDFNVVRPDAYQITIQTIGALDGLNIDRISPTFIGASVPSTALPTSEEDFIRFPQRDVFVFTDFPASIGPITSLSLTTLVHEEEPLIAACEGFYDPFDVTIGLPRKANRVIPLKLELFDPDGSELTPTEITAPVINVARTTGTVGETEPLEAIAVGPATAGNSFVWDETTGLWTYNLATKTYSAAGTYLVTVLAGDAEYVITPSCDGAFVRE